eukprot:9807736-Alexandrium_andersonii.AAC.1
MCIRDSVRSLLERGRQTAPEDNSPMGVHWGVAAPTALGHDAPRGSLECGHLKQLRSAIPQRLAGA